MKFTGIVVSVSLLVLGTVAVQSLPNAQEPLRIDSQAVPKTRLPGMTGMVGAGKAVSPGWLGTTVTATTTAPEAEEFIAIYPTNPNNSVAVISDFSLRLGSNTTKYAVSFNNGAAGTWFDHFIPLQNQMPATADGRTWDFNSNPVVAIDRQGNVYLSSLYFNGSNHANGIYVSVGRLTCLNLGVSAATTFPVVANLEDASTVEDDKDWLAVDNGSNPRTNGNVYASWTRFSGEKNMILISRSVDRGRTWSAPLQVNNAWQNGAVQGSQVAVGPGGEVYVAYECFFEKNKRQHYLAKSTDGGLTFVPAVPITPLFNELTFSSTYRKNSFPALSVSPTNGDVSVVYADQPSSTSGADIEFITSRDGGATFSAPLTINTPSNGQQFMPALTVDNIGVIHVSWFDTRHDLNGTASYDIYATNSADGGRVFAPNARVTATSIDAGNASFIGDYGGIAASGGFAHPVWTSGGFNNGLLQTATLQ
jgi:hypothetical protein